MLQKILSTLLKCSSLYCISNFSTTKYHKPVTWKKRDIRQSVWRREHTLHSCHKLLLLALNCLTVCFAYALHFHSVHFFSMPIQEFTDGDLICSLSKRGFYLKNTLKI